MDYGDEDVRELERLCHTLDRELPPGSLLIWNVRSQIAQLGPLQASWQERGTRRLVIVRGPSDAASILPKATVAPTTSQQITGLADRIPSSTPYVDIHPATFAALSASVNTTYLARGFDERGEHAGFFAGRIQLLSGRRVTRYFALSRSASTPSGVRRWSTSIAAALGEVLATVDDHSPAIAILGLSGALKPILDATMQVTGLPSMTVFTVMTYDLPRVDELERVLASHSRVILVTDVISSASMLVEAHRIVQRLGKTVVGVVALVDGRSDRQRPPLPGTHFVTMATLDVDSTPSEASADEFWVDPVSLIPTVQRPTSVLSVERIDSAIAALSTSGAVRCGHIVDGHRHMSTYVDVARFVEAKLAWVEPRVQEEVHNRIAERHWTAFEPSLVLFPAGVARIETVHAGSPSENAVTSYRSGIGAVLPLLSQLWPNAKPLAVPRSFDPAGRPRCAKVLDEPVGSNTHSDVVVADDCLWTGRAALQLALLAATMGARRILVVSLLARVAAEELAHWESLQTVRAGHAGSTEVCYVFPMVLPIPQYLREECPYDITDVRLRRWTGRANSLAREEDFARADIRAEAPLARHAATSDFTSSWLRLRSYSELAGEDEEFFGRLVEEIRRSGRGASRRALLTLFLEEWSLLGRARLRQSIRPLVRDVAAHTLTDRDAESRDLILACSLLRSLHPEELVERLPDVARHPSVDLDVVGRLLLHIASLSLPLQSHRNVTNCLRDFAGRQELIEAVELGDERTSERAAGLLGICEQFLRHAPRSSELTARGAVQALLSLLTQDEVLTHDAYSWFEVLAAGDAPASYTTETWRRFYDRWSNTYRPIIDTHLQPALAGVEALVLLALAKGSRLATAETDYFTGVNQPDGQFVQDLAAIGFAARALSAREGGSVYLRIIRTACRRLRSNVTSKTSQLVAALEAMRGPRVSDIVDSLVTDLSAKVPGLASDRVTVDRGGGRIVDRHVFCTADIAQTACIAVVDNVRRHAFAQTHSLPPAVHVVVHSVGSDGELRIAVSVLDNGAQLKEGAQPSDTSRRIAADMRLFGGVLHAPTPTTDESWAVTQTVEFLAW